MAEKSAFDYVNDILGIANYVHDLLRSADTARDCPSRISNGYAECANSLINGTDMRGRGYSFDTLRAARSTVYRTSIASSRATA